MSRRVLSLLLCIIMVVSCTGTVRKASANSKKDKGEQTEVRNDVLFASQISVNGKNLVKPESKYNKEKVKNNLLGLLYSDTEIRDSFSVGGKTSLIDQSLYVKGDASVSGTDVVIEKPLVAKGDITISATNVVIKDSAFLLSVNGNIKIYCNSLVFDGPVCAKNTVFISGSKTSFNEAIFAEKIECYIGIFQSDNSIDEASLAGRRDLIAELRFDEDDGICLLYASANFEYDTIDLYGRKHGEDSFSLIKSDMNQGHEILNSWEEYADFAAIMTNSFGFAFKSNPLSTETVNGKREYSYGIDSDNDGVTDDYEVWLSETNPYKKDDFPKSEFQVYLTVDDAVVCYDRLLKREVSRTTSSYKKTYFYDSSNRKTSTEVVYRDGNKKTIRYEYEGDVLQSVYVGENKYTIIDDELSRCYYINGEIVKKIDKTTDSITIDYFDSTKEVIGVDENDNIVSFQNQNLYEMIYDELDLLINESKNGEQYYTFTYDEYGGYKTVDALTHSIRYIKSTNEYLVEYDFGEIKKELKVLRTDSDNPGDYSVILTDGTDGSAIPSENEGKIVLSDENSKTFQYISGNNSYEIQFDDRGYVAREIVADLSSEGSQSIIVTEYSYDSYGNILSVITRNGEECRTQEYRYDKEWSDILVEFDGNRISYDIFGKPTKYYNGMSFSWAAGKLSQIVYDDKTVTYQYGIEGLRDEKRINGVTTKYVYEANNLIAEIGTDTFFYTYDADFRLVGFEWEGKTYYYQYNLLGDVVAIIDLYGETICKYVYNIWGEIVAVEGDERIARRNPIRYRGYYYDEESGFYYLESRYYDPVTKRFLSFDNVESILYGNEENIVGLYVYCENNPVCLLDKNGEASYPNVIFYTDEWKVETWVFKASMERHMDDLFPGQGKYTTSYKMTSADDFINEWNRMGSKDIIVINSHGDDYFFGDSGVYVTLYDIKNRLNNKTLKVLWLLPCYSGRASMMNNNTARAFAKKITGTVIAADGTVQMKTLVFSTYKASGNGWYAYTFYNYGSTFYCKRLYKTELSIHEMLRITGLISG